jgi:hypothetical protein
MSKKYLVVIVLNLAVLLVGIVVGGAVTSRAVLAQSGVEEISPTMSTNVIHANTVAGHRVVADQVIVGDHDMGKLLENLMNLMARKSSVIGGATYTQAELQAVFEGSKVQPIRLKQPEAPKPADKQ